jgi:type II secretory pathway predicted ATPase ExeA
MPGLRRNQVYLEHWGLSRPPFRITPETSQFFAGALRGSILQALEYAILNGEGIVKVSGEVGSGKTMLCRVLEERLSDRLEIVYLGNPSLSPEDVLRAIAFEMDLRIPQDASHLQLIQHLHQALLERHGRGIQVVVFIEEAQRMSVDTLEEIRLLSNLETSRQKLLQMVLFGQPELDDNLSRNEIRQLKERITQNFSLPPFRRKDVEAYLHFRMSNSGYRGPGVFSRRAIKAITRASCGLARRVSILADKSLLAAFADGSHIVRRKHASTAIADC